MGQRDVPFKLASGANKGITFQVTNVSRPLLSVSKLKAKGYGVYMDDKPRIENRATKEVMALKEENGLYILEVFIKNEHMGFARPGK